MSDELTELLRTEPWAPGPLERSWRARLHWWFFRRWPDYVAKERVADHDRRVAEQRERIDAYFERRRDEGRHDRRV